DGLGTASALVEVGRIHIEAARYPLAMELLERAVAIRERELGPGHPEVATALSVLAQAATRGEEGGRGGAGVNRALGISEAALGSETPALFPLLIEIAAAASDSDPGPRGRAAVLARALALADALHEAPRPDVARLLMEAGRLQIGPNTPAARTILERAL